MHPSHELISKAACRLAAEVPLPTAEIVARWINGSQSLAEARQHVGQQLAHPHYRSHSTWFIDTCLNAASTTPPQAVALALLTAAHAEKTHREEQSVELVWTGPDAEMVPFRRTEQAILQVLDSAQKRITLVSYAVYRIPFVCEALIKAARRGVVITVVVETPDRIEGQSEYSTLSALGGEVASCAAVFFWPREQRQAHESGKLGILHVKCAVADGRWMFLSSANLTQYAFSINMELGVLITGGTIPGHVEGNFDRLITMGVLQRV